MKFGAHNYYFDSMGRDHLDNLMGMTMPICNTVKYQHSSSSTCGLFVTLAAALYSKGFDNYEEYQNALDMLLSPDEIVNEFNINLFGALQKIGEEFNNPLYVQTGRMIEFCDNL